jgi:hypothetical protein
MSAKRFSLALPCGELRETSLACKHDHCFTVVGRREEEAKWWLSAEHKHSARTPIEHREEPAIFLWEMNQASCRRLASESTYNLFVLSVLAKRLHGTLVMRVNRNDELICC